MSIAKGGAVISRPNQAADQDVNDSRRPTLMATQSVIRKEDGSVVIREKTVNGNISETRVDSDQDADLIAKGGKPWWDSLVQDDVVEETTEVVTTLDPRVAPAIPAAEALIAADAKKAETAEKSRITKAANKAAKAEKE